MSTNHIDINVATATLAVEIREPSGRGEPTATTQATAPAPTLADLTTAHQALVARCTELMNAFVVAQNAAEAAYNQNTLLSAQANAAWQFHREQSHLANQLHDQWHNALRERQDLFAEIHKLERML